MNNLTDGNNCLRKLTKLFQIMLSGVVTGFGETRANGSPRVCVKIDSTSLASFAQNDSTRLET